MVRPNTHRLEIGATSKLGYLLPSNFDHANLFTDETFKICQPLTDKTCLIYECYFQDFENAEYLYLKAKQADEANKLVDWMEYIEKLNNQPIYFLKAEIK